MADFIIDDSTDPDLIFTPFIDGEQKRGGYVERDFKIYPADMFDPPSNIPLIPRSEWDARIEEINKTQSGLEHIRSIMANGSHMPSLDQNGHGYCWAYSTGSCLMMVRARMNLPYVRLNPHSVAAIIKGGADQGGWCGLSAKFLREHGIASEEHWPKHSRSLANDTPACRANMALHKTTEEWVDLTRSVYDQNLTFDQVATCLLLNIPCAVDFNWWAHSVCAISLVRIEAGSYGLKILNSWTDGWGDKGTGILQGSRAIPNGALAIRSTTPSLK